MRSSFGLVKPLLLVAFLVCACLIHFRGRVRHPFFRRQLTDHSSFFSAYNLLMYLFSAVPTRPYLEPQRFSALEPLRQHWRDIREEALRLLELGLLSAEERHEDVGYSSFFRRGWQRFHLKWYRQPLSSAQTLCPRTIELLKAIPSVKSATFALLPAGARLGAHRDPFAGSLRYHLGLVTPNSDLCSITVDGETYFWRDGKDVIFDETYVHHVENRSGIARVILLCDIERPLHTPVMRMLNRFCSAVLGRATEVRNRPGEPLGVLNRLYFVAYHVGAFGKRLKAANRAAYETLKIILGVTLLYWALH